MILVAIILLAQPIVASLILDRIYGSSYRREMRSKRSFVSLAALLAVEQEISHNKELCKEDGTERAHEEFTARIGEGVFS